MQIEARKFMALGCGRPAVHSSRSHAPAWERTERTLCVPVSTPPGKAAGAAIQGVPTGHAAHGVPWERVTSYSGSPSRTWSGVATTTSPGASPEAMRMRPAAASPSETICSRTIPPRTTKTAATSPRLRTAAWGTYKFALPLVQLQLRGDEQPGAEHGRRDWAPPPRRTANGCRRPPPA